MPFIEITDLVPKELVKGFDARFIHTDDLTIAYVNIREGSILPEHSHIHEQITHVLEGRLQLTIEGETDIVEAGRVAVIPSNFKHSALALTDCKALDVFNPAREDYKKL